MLEKRQYSFIDTQLIDLVFSQQKPMKKADLHIHSIWSDGVTSPEEIVDIALLLGLHAVAITDHDVYQSSKIACEYSRRNNLPIEVIKATEVSSADGHLLAYNIQEPLQVGLSLANSIREIHRQGGLAVAAHPGLPLISSLSLVKISEIIQSDDPSLYFDGIEIYNATGERMQRLDKKGVIFGKTSQKLKTFIMEHRANPKLGALVGGTDAHTRTLGEGITVYSRNSIIDAIKNGDTMVMAADTNMVDDLFEIMTMTYSIIRAHVVGSM